MSGIHHEDTYYRINPITGERTEIEKPRPSSPVDDFLENFKKNSVITFGESASIMEKVKEMQRKWLTYITGLYAFNEEEYSIDKLKISLSNDNNELIKNHQQFFYENQWLKPYEEKVGVLRSIGLDYLTRLQEHLKQLEKQTGGRKKRKKSKHRKRRKSRTKRRKKKTKKRRKKRYKFKRKSRRKRRC